VEENQQELLEKADVTQWLKGSPRSFEEASACVFLAAGCPASTTRRPVPVPQGTIVAPHETGMVMAEIIQPVQPFRLMCNNPFIIQVSQLSAEAAPGDAPKLGKIQAMELASLDICRLCPYHKGPTKQ
jgi:hypothetical protein